MVETITQYAQRKYEHSLNETNTELTKSQLVQMTQRKQMNDTKNIYCICKLGQKSKNTPSLIWIMLCT